jgi:acyl-CoA dehydrogenase
VKDRRAFSQTVWDFQNTKFKLADVKAQSVAVRTLVDYYLGEHLRRKLSVQEAAIAKLYATEALWKCLDDMVQLHGGYGYMLEYPIARAFTDYRVSRVVGGANEVMRDLIARKL